MKPNASPGERAEQPGCGDHAHIRFDSMRSCLRRTASSFRCSIRRGHTRSGRLLPARRRLPRSWWETKSAASATRCLPRRSFSTTTRALRRKALAISSTAREIDEILTLRVMAMTDAEKSEMRQVDDFARRILERTGVARTRPLDEDAWAAIRDLRPFEEDFASNTRLESVSRRRSQRESRRPRAHSSERSRRYHGPCTRWENRRRRRRSSRTLEARVHSRSSCSKMTPAKTLGLMRQPGTDFSTAPDEVEPLPEGT